ncbi:hypothetical protein ZIOFF_048246 [Zingiber officinale]|uniref:RNA-dependent RNA polymerase n=1 Tax=Zingiber officinale TaxID=94328 RepID=A0A8J5FQY1_ZINOF|nr:hypothetical protein ZIOFF_048246 [Zingiber officinale]
MIPRTKAIPRRADLNGSREASEGMVASVVQITFFDVVTMVLNRSDERFVLLEFLKRTPGSLSDGFTDKQTNKHIVNIYQTQPSIFVAADASNLVASMADQVLPDKIGAPTIQSFQKAGLLYRDHPLQLSYKGMKVHFGVNPKFTDYAGQSKPSIVVDAPCNLCKFFDIYDQVAQASSKNYGSNSDLEHAEAFFSKPDVAELESIFVPGITVDAYFAIDIQFYLQNLLPQQLLQGPYLQLQRTHMQRVLGDDNVLLVKFAEEMNIGKGSHAFQGYESIYHKVAQEGILVGLRRYQFFVGWLRHQFGLKIIASLTSCLNFVYYFGVNDNFLYVPCGIYQCRFSLILSKTMKLDIDLASVHVEMIDDIVCVDDDGNISYDENGEPLIHTDGTGFISEDIALKCPHHIFKGKCSTPMSNQVCPFSFIAPYINPKYALVLITTFLCL